LKLNELETFDTRVSVQDNALNALVGLLSVVVAVRGGSRYTFVAGMVYWLIAPAQFAHGFAMGRRRKRLAQRVARTVESSLGAPTNRPA
jgi:hypothetical protein